jgi:TRAP-type uncharacterized transport system substrate-binding protein
LKTYLFLFLLLLFSGCDIFRPKTTYKLAVPENDYSYNISAQHLVSLLKEGGFKIEIIPTKNAIEANQLVAQGKADLTFIMNHSEFIPEKLGSQAGKLRTICPMYQRLLFLFSEDPVDDSLNTRELLEGRSIGIEVLNGETQANLNSFFTSGKIDDVSIVSRDQNPELIHFWGTYYGPRATQLLEAGWEEISLSPSWINFITLNDPSLDPYVLPAIPGVEGSQNINTISAQTLLVGNRDLGEKAIFKLSSYIYQHKLDLMKFDIMYRSINEVFDVSGLLYPLHEGTDAYFRRHQPTFFERYADVLALVFSFIVVFFGIVQAVRNRMRKKKKERIDLYFLEFLDIKSGKSSKAEMIGLLDDLLRRALIQMTSEKMDKTDFHIFSRLLQQELSNLRFGV